MNFRETLFVNKGGKLEIGGVEAGVLAREFGTPLYVLDEEHVRNMCRAFRESGADVFYAGKAFCCKEIYRIVASEGLGADVVSGGELYTALSAGVFPERITFHGNNKTEKELTEAVAAGVGRIAADAYDEIDILDKTARREGKVQEILLRINNGVEAHTHDYIKTTGLDSKFGFPISSGGAEDAFKHAAGKKNLKIAGFHCHIGSQIFEGKSFEVSAETMLSFIKTVKDKYGFTTRELVLGGGFGVWYGGEDPKLKPADYTAHLKTIYGNVKKLCAAKGLSEPKLAFEPGRAIVGEAGITLYTVGAVKEVKGQKKYVCVDGGMFDNPRYALYKARYSALLAERAAEPPVEKVAVAGKCCESGDLISVDVPLAAAVRGDILAVFTTGAYNYAMASHYNRNLVPPVVSVYRGRAKYIIRPESYEDLVRNDI